MPLPEAVELTADEALAVVINSEPTVEDNDHLQMDYQPKMTRLVFLRGGFYLAARLSHTRGRVNVAPTVWI